VGAQGPVGLHGALARVVGWGQGVVDARSFDAGGASPMTRRFDPRDS
jgi:hypothetical protein